MVPTRSATPEGNVAGTAAAVAVAATAAVFAGGVSFGP